MSIREMGLGSETMPFDWIQTRVEGILHYLRHDFNGFMDYSTKVSYSASEASYVFRDALHSFWHDDPEDPGDVAKYRRRIARFNALDASFQRLLFVRTVAETRELYRADELFREIVSRYGERAHLLLIVDMQRQIQGPILFNDRSNLMIYFQSLAALSGVKALWYAKPIQCALDWMEGQSVNATNLSGIKNFDSLHIDHYGLQASFVSPFDEF